MPNNRAVDGATVPPATGGDSSTAADAATGVVGDNSPPSTLLRRQRPPRAHRDGLLVPYTVSVPVAMAHFDHTGCVIRYMIRVVDHAAGVVSCVFRRYSEVVAFHKSVGGRLDAVKRKLPGKIWTQRANRCVDEIEERRAALGAYFTSLLQTLFMNTDDQDRREGSEPSTVSRSSGHSSSDRSPASVVANSPLRQMRISTALFLDLEYEEAAPSNASGRSSSRHPQRSGSEIGGTASRSHLLRPSMCSPVVTSSSFVGPSFAMSPKTPPTGSSFAAPAALSSAAGAGNSSKKFRSADSVGSDGAGTSSTPHHQYPSNASAASSTTGSAAVTWEDSTLHREETWWTVPGVRMPMAPSGSTTSSRTPTFAALGETSSYHTNGPDASPVSQRPRRRVIGYSLPLMECRLQIDGTWVLIVRHDRGATKPLVRRRHAEALHLLRFIDNATYLPSVGELREVLNRFKRRHPEHQFNDTIMRHRFMSSQSAALASASARRAAQRADDADRDATARLSKRCLQQLRPADDDVDELDLTAVSSVTDVKPARRPAANDGAAALESGDSGRRFSAAGGARDDDMLTLVDMQSTVSAWDGPSWRRSVSQQNSAHYNYAAITVVPWRAKTPPPLLAAAAAAGGEDGDRAATAAGGAAAGRGGPSTGAIITTTADLGLQPDLEPPPNPAILRRSSALEVPPAVSVSPAVPEASDDEPEPRRTSPEMAGAGTPNTSQRRLALNSPALRSASAADPTTVTGRIDSFASASFLVDEASLSAPSHKVKVRAKNASFRACRCDFGHFCQSGRGNGDVYATLDGHCIVVHPSTSVTSSDEA